MAEAAYVEVDVIKAVPVPVAPSFVRAVLGRAASLTELVARMPEGASTIAVRLTSDRELRRLNRDYAGNDSVTDVLSFGGSGHHLGDVAISWPAVVRQAELYHHPAPTELALLTVHGMLHLLGWDHTTAAEYREMARLTVAALGLCGLTVSDGRF